MANTQLAQRVWEIFARPTPPQRIEFHNNLEGLPEEARIEVFSPFNEKHAERAKLFVDKWNATASSGADEERSLNAVLDDFESLRGKENPDLLYFALEIFLTHYKGSVTIEIPSLMVREPELTGPGGEKEKNLEVALGSANETRLDWFREDPLLNEHHGHWHVVYFTQNVYDRQGEMFFYMHQQMLARYDAERLSENVPRVKPFSDMTNPIAVGYTAGPDERLGGKYGVDRKVNARVSAADVQVQHGMRAALIADIDRGVYDLRSGNDPLKQETDAINALGSTVEANNNPHGYNAAYRGYHGAGHNWIGKLNNGVMLSTVVAIRDVIFWEWHKEVDTHFQRLQQRFDPYDFKREAPPVTLRNGSDATGQPDSMDIILCASSAIPGFGKPGFDGNLFGYMMFGFANWNTDFGKGKFILADSKGKEESLVVDTTDTLVTNMNRGLVTYRDSAGKRQYEFQYLNHEPFCYFIRVYNDSPQERLVTVRIFLVPDAQKEDRGMWIEMDKFMYKLLPSSGTVIYRSDTDSSVIRKPAVMNPSSYAVNYNPLVGGQNPEDSKCRCGWPYHLLLPKGGDSETGAPYKLMVMMSDGEKDSIEHEGGCGSLSFCAARNDLYPDKRPLGYPFNRKFKGPIMNTLTTHPNFACRSIYIQHIPE